jgi:hypothetical protein
MGGNFAQVPHKREQIELLLQLGCEFLFGWIAFHFACGCLHT